MILLQFLPRFQTRAAHCVDSNWENASPGGARGPQAAATNAGSPTPHPRSLQPGAAARSQAGSPPPPPALTSHLQRKGGSQHLSCFPRSPSQEVAGVQTRGRGAHAACLSLGAPVPRSPPPRPQECAGAGPEATAAPPVSWAQLSHIRPGPAGRSQPRDAPVPATKPEGGTLTAPSTAMAVRGGEAGLG